MKYECEMTDTFCGEANYAWVHRFVIEANTLRGALIKAKKHTNWLPRRHKTTNYGDMLRLDAIGSHVCMFITHRDPTYPDERFKEVG